MEKNKIKMLMFLVLLAVGAFFWLYPHLKRKGIVKEAVTRGYEVIEINEPNYAEDFFETQRRLEGKRSKLVWVRNPFILPQKETQTVESDVRELVLSGIAVDEVGRIAIVNDRIVREGDTISGVKIIEIKEDSIIVEKEGKSYTLRLY